MTDTEIIKALECCPYQRDCVSCGVDSCNNSPNYIMKNALDLINRHKELIEKSERVEHFADKTIKAQKAEIERLQSMNQAKLDTIHDIRAENERLKEENEIKSQKRANIFEITNAYERGMVEGVKRVAERLKEFKLYVGNSQGVFITDEDIDNLLKETVGDE